MTRYAVLLRGVNVGGRARVPMAELRAALTGAGYTDVTTLLQSGNVVLTATTRAPAVAAGVAAVISDAFDLAVPCLVRTAPELTTALAGVPYDDAEDTYLAFLSEQPADDRVAAFDLRAHAPDELRLGDRVAYLRYPAGAGRTKLTNDLIERRLGVRSTTRNWRTTTKVLGALTDG